MGFVEGNKRRVNCGFGGGLTGARVAVEGLIAMIVVTDIDGGDEVDEKNGNLHTSVITIVVVAAEPKNLNKRMRRYAIT